MLTPDEMNRLGLSIQVKARELEDGILEAIGVEVSAGMQSGNAKKARLRLEAAINQSLHDWIEENNSYLINLFAHCGILATNTSEWSQGMLTAVNRAFQQTKGEIMNFTRTTAHNAGGRLYDRLNQAFIEVSTGQKQYDEAIMQACDDLADHMHYVTYDTGRHDTLEVAIRRAILTGANQGATDAVLQQVSELGLEFVEVSAHYGARPSHTEWQGKIYHIGGEVTIDGKRYGDFESETGYGTGAGLCGWNCRHSFHAYDPDTSEPTYTQEELDDMKGEKGNRIYEVSQRQRALERKVRKVKRRYIAEQSAGGVTEKTEKDLTEAQLALDAFVKEPANFDYNGGHNYEIRTYIPQAVIRKAK